MAVEYESPLSSSACRICSAPSDEPDGLCAECHLKAEGQALAPVNPGPLLYPVPRSSGEPTAIPLSAPGVTSAQPQAPVPSASAGGTRNRVIVGAVISALALGLVASGAWGVSTKSELDSTRADLATTQGTVTQLQSTLDTVSGQLRTTEGNLAAERQHSDALGANNASLQSQVASLNSCMAELRTEQTEFQALVARQSDNFNATAKGSKWDAARSTQIAQLLKVADAYYDAYSAAWDEHYSSANSFIAKGNAAYKRAVAAAKTMSAEIGKVNAETDALDSAWAALQGRIDATAATCSAGAGDSS